MKIAILDSGIDHNHSMFKKLNIENYIYEEETKTWIAKEHSCNSLKAPIE